MPSEIVHPAGNVNVFPVVSEPQAEIVARLRGGAPMSFAVDPIAQP